MGQRAEGGSFLLGLRVLELGDEHVEYCGKVLAGLGAEVLKVEPLGGESTRGYGPFVDGRTDVNASLYFQHYNFGKRSLVVDVESEAGVEKFRELARVADVILDGRPRGYLDARGLSYEDLSGENPGLIYVHVSPFGDDGPWRDFRGSDLVHLALGGVMLNCGYDPVPGGDYDTPPIAPQMWQAYQICGENTAIQVIAALHHRLRTGAGQQLVSSVHEAVSLNTESDFPDWLYRRVEHARVTCRHSFPNDGAGGGASTTLGASATKDGRWLKPYQTYLAGPASSTKPLVDLMAPYGMEDDLAAPQYDDAAFVRRPEVLRHINDVINRFVASFKFDANIWLQAQRVGMPWAPIRRPEENLGDRHWRERETFIDIVDPELGRPITHVRAKWLAHGLPWRSGPLAPALGEAGDMTADKWVSSTTGHPRTSTVERPAVISKLGRPFALSGVRVLDLGWILASAGGGRFLAAHGAEVIKVEHTSRLDMLRNAPAAPSRAGTGVDRDAASEPSVNRSGAFMDVNAGKLAASLNLKSERGRQLLLDLVRQADVLVEGFSPGTMDRLGLGYETLRQVNPALVYVQQSGMGQTGDYGPLKAFGPTAQAMSGITDMSGLPEPYPPAGIGYSYLDWFGAYQIALAMLAGLYRREVTGEGCWIDSSQVEAGIYLTGPTVLDFSVNGRSWRRVGNRSASKPAAPHGAYRVRGRDRWIAIAVFTDAEWHALVRVLRCPEWANDPRFATLERRISNQDALDALVDSAASTWDGDELMCALQSAGVAAGVCQSAEDRIEKDPQLRHLGWTTELVQSELGSWPAKSTPVRFSESPAYMGGIRDRHGPNYGEDNQYVYEELLGLSPDEISALAEAGVI